MSFEGVKQVENLVVDTTAFIQNASLFNVAENMVTCQEVIDEIKNKRQLRRLVMLPYELVVKNVFPENIQIVTDFAKKTGDYPSLSATDIKVIALTYQLEKEKNGVEHLRSEPVLPRPLINTEQPAHQLNPDITGFFLPRKGENKLNNEKYHIEEPKDDQEIVESKQNNFCSESKKHLFVLKNVNTKEKSDDKEPDTKETTEDSLTNKFGSLNFNNADLELEENIDILLPVKHESKFSEDDTEDQDDDDDDIGWITPSNVKQAKKQINSQLMEDKHVAVACMSTDFAMQNVLKQMNLNICALDGRIIKQLRTYILRCYTCFKTTSIMTKQFCPKCGNNTLKRVAVSVDETGKMQIHINPRKPLTGRGKKFSLPKIKGGKHPNNPVLVADQPMADNRPSRLARMKNNPLDDDYIAGFSPFIMRDVNSKSAQLGIRPNMEFKQWMKKNPNESRRKRK
ncbi:RNA-binding protein NOB1 [Euwallacea fornicatus]|uniref:RNA-binding protein NOB1 n=1 Tax=Euwallacea fornicatus TaxID=995702 RepID=UPI00338DD5DD